MRRVLIITFAACWAVASGVVAPGRGQPPPENVIVQGTVLGLEGPLAGARIFVGPGVVEGAGGMEPVQSDEAGRFKAVVPWTDRPQLRIEADGYRPAWFGDLEFQEGETYTFDVTLVPEAELNVHLLRSDGEPLRETSVTCTVYHRGGTGPDLVQMDQKTNPEGELPVIREAHEARLAVAVHAQEAGYVLSPLLTLRAGTSPQRLELTLQPGQRLAVTLRKVGTGEPVADFMLRVKLLIAYEVEVPMLQWDVATDAQGRLGVDHLPPGRYQIEPRLPTSPSACEGGWGIVQLLDTGETRPAELEVPRVLRLKVQVRRPDDEPLVNTAFHVQWTWSRHHPGGSNSNGGGVRVTTDGEGCFVLALPVGKHKLTLETEGYEPATVDNVLSTGWGPDRDVVVRLGPQG